MRLGRNKYVPVLAENAVKKNLAKFVQKKKIRMAKLTPEFIKASWRLISDHARCRTRTLKLKMESCPRCKPSSGFLAISTALALCGRVSVYGMGGSRYAGEYPYHYYKFKGTELVKGYSGHMFETEKALVRLLADRAHITLCLLQEAKRDCSANTVAEHPCCSGPGEGALRS